MNSNIGNHNACNNNSKFSSINSSIGTKQSEENTQTQFYGVKDNFPQSQENTERYSMLMEGCSTNDERVTEKEKVGLYKYI
jgi:hypothetical protein